MVFYWYDKSLFECSIVDLVNVFALLEDGRVFFCDLDLSRFICDLMLWNFYSCCYNRLYYDLISSLSCSLLMWLSWSSVNFLGTPFLMRPSFLGCDFLTLAVYGRLAGCFFRLFSTNEGSITEESWSMKPFPSWILLKVIEPPEIFWVSFKMNSLITSLGNGKVPKGLLSYSWRSCFKRANLLWWSSLSMLDRISSLKREGYFSTMSGA